MEGYTRKDGDGCPQLLDLISKESRKFLVKCENEKSRNGANNTDDKQLELSLGPPCSDWAINDSNSSKNHHFNGDDDNNSSFFSFGGYFSSNTTTTTTNNHHKFSSSPWPSSSLSASVYQPKESSKLCCTTKVVGELQQQTADKMAFSAASTAVANSAQKRMASAPVVGWPPIRSFRKNLASSSSSLKSASESPNVVPNKAASKQPITEKKSGQKGLFVKINMDSVPIGRKVDLNVYDSYEKLSVAVDELFRGLLAAQHDSPAGGTQDKDGEEKLITGLLDGTGEYTLVYEDNEGDRMLVGDVPWPMFVSTVTRLRVLKSSELPRLHRGSEHGKLIIHS